MINGQMTLLDLTQSLLGSMESDEVNSINDTLESYNVALLLRDVFYDLATDLNLEEQDQVITLNASGSVSTPTLMTVPTNVSKVYWVKYDQARLTDVNPTFPLFQEVDFVPFDEFLIMQQGLRSDKLASLGGDVGLQTIQSGTYNFQIPYKTTAFPSFYTSFDHTQILFDSYLASLESTLQAVNSMALVRIFPEFQLVDTFVPPLDNNQFSYFRNKAKVRAFAEFKQIQNTEAIKEASRQKQVVIRDRTKIDNRAPIYKVQARYGRKGGFTTGSINYNGD